MTNKKIAHPKKSTKRPQKDREEQPVDSEIRRAAERAGIAVRTERSSRHGGAS